MSYSCDFIIHFFAL